MQKNEYLLRFTLRLADDALILGHRLCEWSGKAPILEEDLALSNIALDLMGRAESLYRYCAELENKNNNEDYFAYRRDERQFQNHLITEQENGDFAHTIVRQFIFSTYELHAYTILSKSKDEHLAAIANKTLKEIKYHVKHSRGWCIRLGKGTEESFKRMQLAIDDLWMYTGELFELDSIDQWLIDAGVISDISKIKNICLEEIKNCFESCKLSIPDNMFMQSGGKKGIHTEHLGFILAEMQYLQRAYPNAKW
ncbi:MAG: 1,2-phenylacetyl-CoA epoxidase subunit PaaC [Bacteroidia bacterium]